MLREVRSFKDTDGLKNSVALLVYLLDVSLRFVAMRVGSCVSDGCAEET
jgi:hypothetical protein